MLQEKLTTFMVQITASPSQILLPNPVGMGLFSFLDQKSASKALKSAILLTFQANGEATAPRPPGYATGSFLFECNKNALHQLIIMSF